MSDLVTTFFELHFFTWLDGFFNLPEFNYIIASACLFGIAGIILSFLRCD